MRRNIKIGVWAYDFGQGRETAANTYKRGNYGVEIYDMVET